MKKKTIRNIAIIASVSLIATGIVTPAVWFSFRGHKTTKVVQTENDQNQLIKSLNQKLKQLTEQKNGLTDQNKKLEIQKQQNLDRIHQLEKSTDSIKQIDQKLQDTYNQKESKVNALKKQIQDIEQQIQQVNATTKAKQDALDKDVQATDQAIANKKQELAQAEAQAQEKIGALTKQLDQLKQDLANAQNQYHEHQAQQAKTNAGLIQQAIDNVSAVNATLPTQTTLNNSQLANSKELAPTYTAMQKNLESILNNPKTPNNVKGQVQKTLAALKTLVDSRKKLDGQLTQQNQDLSALNNATEKTPSTGLAQKLINDLTNLKQLYTKKAELENQWLKASPTDRGSVDQDLTTNQNAINTQVTTVKTANDGYINAINKIKADANALQPLESDVNDNRVALNNSINVLQNLQQENYKNASVPVVPNGQIGLDSEAQKVANANAETATVNATGANNNAANNKTLASQNQTTITNAENVIKQTIAANKTEKDKTIIADQQAVIAAAQKVATAAQQVETLHNSLAKNFKELSDENNTLAQQNKALANFLGDKIKQENIINDPKSSEAQKQAAQKALNTLVPEITQAQQDIQTTDKNINALQDKINGEQTGLNQAQADLNTNKNDLNQAQAKLDNDTNAAKIAALKQAIAEKKQELTQTQTAADAANKKAQEEITQDEHKLAEAKKALNDYNDQAKQKVQALTNQKQQLTKQLSDTQQQMHTAAAQAATTNSENAQAAAQNATQVSQTATAQAQTVNATKAFQNTALNNAKKALAEANGVSNSTNSKITKDKQALIKAANAVTTAANNLNDKITAQADDLKQLATDSQSLSNKEQQLANALKAKAQAENTLANPKASANDIASAQEALTTADGKIKTLIPAVKTLNDKVIADQNKLHDDATAVQTAKAALQQANDALPEAQKTLQQDLGNHQHSSKVDPLNIDAGVAESNSQMSASNAAANKVAADTITQNQLPNIANIKKAAAQIAADSANQLKTEPDNKNLQAVNSAANEVSQKANAAIAANQKLANALNSLQTANHNLSTAQNTLSQALTKKAQEEGIIANPASTPAQIAAAKKAIKDTIDPEIQQAQSDVIQKATAVNQLQNEINGNPKADPATVGLKTLANNADKDLTAAQNQLQTAQQNNQAANQTTAQSKISALQKQLQDVNQSLTQAQAENKNITNAGNAKVKQLQDSLNDAKAKLASAEKQAQQEIATQQQALKTAQQQLQAAQNNSKFNANTIKASANLYTDWAQQLSALVTQETNEKTTLTADLNKETSLKNYLQTLVTSLSADIGAKSTLPPKVVQAYQEVIQTVKTYQSKVDTLISDYQDAIKNLDSLIVANSSLKTQADNVATGYNALSPIVEKINALSPSSATYDSDFQTQYANYSEKVSALNAEISQFKQAFDSATTSGNNFNAAQSQIQQQENLNINGKLGLVEALNNLTKTLQAANTPTIPFDTAVTQNNIDITNKAISNNELKQAQMSKEAANAATQANNQSGATVTWAQGVVKNMTAELTPTGSLNSAQTQAVNNIKQAAQAVIPLAQTAATANQKLSAAMKNLAQEESNLANGPQKSLATAYENIAKAQKAYEAAKGDVTAQAAALKQLETANAAAKTALSQVQAAETQIAADQKQLVTLKNNAAQADVALQTQKDKVLQAVIGLNNANQDVIKNLQAQQTTAQGKLDSANKTLEDTKAANQKELNSLNDQKQKLQQEISQLQPQVTKAQQAQKQVQSLQNQIKQLGSENKTLQTANQANQQVISDQNSQIQKLKSANQKIDTANQEVNKQIAKIQPQINNIKNANKQIATIVDNETAIINHIQAFSYFTYEQMQNYFNNYQSSINDYSGTSQQLQADIASTGFNLFLPLVTQLTATNSFNYNSLTSDSNGMANGHLSTYLQQQGVANSNLNLNYALGNFMSAYNKTFSSNYYYSFDGSMNPLKFFLKYFSLLSMNDSTGNYGQPINKSDGVPTTSSSSTGTSTTSGATNTPYDVKYTNPDLGPSWLTYWLAQWLSLYNLPELTTNSQGEVVSTGKTLAPLTDEQTQFFYNWAKYNFISSSNTAGTIGTNFSSAVNPQVQYFYNTQDALINLTFNPTFVWNNKKYIIKPQDLKIGKFVKENIGAGNSSFKNPGVSEHFVLNDSITQNMLLTDSTNNNGIIFDVNFNGYAQTNYTTSEGQTASLTGYTPDLWQTANQFTQGTYSYWNNQETLFNNPNWQTSILSSSVSWTTLWNVPQTLGISTNSAPNYSPLSSDYWTN
ncbi:hypothetical protein [Ureaplasma ceti]|uniref:Uncharacterized protein n=1 Tax=Ureaplasma ceti TaxID=3119530 RepID=A0ABP9U835_9BACT